MSNIIQDAINALENDKELVADTEKYLDNMEAVLRGSLVTAVRLIVDLGPDVLAAMPRVGSTPKDVAGTNRPSDKYTKQVLVDGEHKEKSYSRIREFAEGTPMGVAISKRKEAASNLDLNNPGEKAALVANETKRMNNLVALIRRSLQICERIEEVSALANIGLRIFSTPVKPKNGGGSFKFPAMEGVDRLWKAGEYLVTTPKPILLSDRVANNVGGFNFENEGAYSVGQFLSFKPLGKVVVDKDGNRVEDQCKAPLGEDATLSDLKATAKRGPREEEQQSGRPGLIATHYSNDKEFFDGAMEFAYYINPDNEDTASHLPRLFATKDDTLFKLLCDVGEWIHDRMHGAVLERYQALIEMDTRVAQAVSGNTPSTETGKKLLAAVKASKQPKKAS